MKPDICPCFLHTKVEQSDQRIYRFAKKRKPISTCSHGHAILHVIYGCIDTLLFYIKLIEYQGEALQIAVSSQSRYCSVGSNQY